MIPTIIFLGLERNKNVISIFMALCESFLKFFQEYFMYVQTDSNAGKRNKDEKEKLYFYTYCKNPMDK